MQIGLVFPAAGLLAAMPALAAMAVVVPQGTPVHVQIDQRTAMHLGQKIRAHVVEPIYVATQIVIPAGASVSGTVSELTPDKKARRSARFDGDFTPLDIPVIQFTMLTLPDHQTLTLAAAPATRGAPQLKIVSVPAVHQSLARQLWAQGLLQWQQTKESITAPGKKERLTDLMYGQLPYHPQRIRRDTQWTFDLTAPLEVAENPEWQSAATHETQTDPNVLRVHAYLASDLDSASSKDGDRFEAIVTSPLYAADHSVAVPVGSVLEGQVTESKPARHFGRDGKLRFVFRELQRPEQQQTIQGSAVAAVTDKSSALALDSEGGFHPAKRNRLVNPLLLAVLGTRALDDDNDHAQLGTKTVSSNGFGMIGRIVGMTAAPREVATGFGFYATAVSLCRNFVLHGKNVSFARGTRIDVESVPTHGDKMPVR